MASVFCGLGSNVGNRELNLFAAVQELTMLADAANFRCSPIYETDPVGMTEQPAFLNAVIQIQTTFLPLQLLEIVLLIERNLGRERRMRWGPRTIDLDLLLYDDEMLSTPQLTIPHQRLAERRFVLVPLADIAPEVIVPGRGLSVTRLLQLCEDSSKVVRYRPIEITWQATN